MRSFHEPSDPLDFFDLENVADVRRAEQERHEAAVRRSEEMAEQDRQAEAIRKARADKRTMETNERMLIGEYRRMGVNPPFVNEDGKPTVSLSMLMKRGWTVEEFGGKRLLIAPLSEPPVRKQSEV